MTPHTIYFVRHGETLWNTERRWQGRKDSALTEAGRAHALANAETLLEAIPDVLSLSFVSSPLGRARATMDIIRQRLGMPVSGYAIDDRLAELSFGEWEGMTAEEIRAAAPEAWTAFEAAPWQGARGGESYEALVARLNAWLAELQGDVVVVGHGAVGRALRGINLGLSVQEIPSFRTPKNDRVYRICRGSEAVL